MTRRTVVMVAAALVTGWLAAAQAQTPGASNNGDIMPALLAEVRGLRVAMEQMTSAALPGAAGARTPAVAGAAVEHGERPARSRSAISSAPPSAAPLRCRNGPPVSKAWCPASARCQGPTRKRRPTDPATRSRGEMAGAAASKVIAANAEVQRLTIQENTLANERLDRTGALVGSQPAASRISNGRSGP